MFCTVATWVGVVAFRQVIAVGGSATFPYAKHNIYPIQQKDRGCGSSGLVDGIYFILLRSPWLQSP